jgi:hypothetical protein
LEASVMELSEEQKQRILAEEHQRIAEDQFRADVRSKLKGDSDAPRRQSRSLRWVLGVGAVLIAGTLLEFNGNNQKRKAGDDSAPIAQAASKPVPVAKTRYVPVNQKVASGQIIVKANGYVQYRLTITPEMLEPTVRGNFNASGGSGNDIAAVVADEMNFTNWINGHQAQVFWATQGKQTAGNFEVELAPGVYYLVFSNKFSAFTDKQVFLEVDLTFRKAEVYYE